METAVANTQQSQLNKQAYRMLKSYEKGKSPCGHNVIENKMIAKFLNTKGTEGAEGKFFYCAECKEIINYKVSVIDNSMVHTTDCEQNFIKKNPDFNSLLRFGSITSAIYLLSDCDDKECNKQKQKNIRYEQATPPKPDPAANREYDAIEAMEGIMVDFI